MTVKRQDVDGQVVLLIEGCIDTNTAPELEGIVDKIEANDLVFDFTNVEYISSAGLRLMLSVQKNFNQKKGNFVIKNPNEVVYDIFGISGLLKIVNVK